jgi:hypothetical protein
VTQAHEPRVEQHDLYEGYQVTCPCGWRSGLTSQPDTAQAIADRHVVNHTNLTPATAGHPTT